jgi:hypothetical protein
MGEHPMRVQPKMIMTSSPGRGHRICLVHYERIHTSPATSPGCRQTGRTSTNDDNLLVHGASMALFLIAVNKLPRHPAAGLAKAAFETA